MRNCGSRALLLVPFLFMLLVRLPSGAAQSLDISGTWTGAWVSGSGSSITLTVTSVATNSFSLLWNQSGGASGQSWRGTAEVYPASFSATLPNGQIVTTKSAVLGTVVVHVQGCDLHTWTLTNKSRIDGHFSCKIGAGDVNDAFTLVRTK